MLSSGDLAVLGSLDITVANPAPGGGVSNSISFDVVQPAPGVLRIATLASDGTQTNADSVIASFSADGRFVAFDSEATNLVPNDTNVSSDVFLRDTCMGVAVACTPSTTRVSVSTDGTEGNGLSNHPSISADGRYIAFYSVANNLVPNDTNFAGDIFVRDTCTGAPAGCNPSTTRVSLANDGSESNYDVALPLISSNGRFVVFTSQASNLVPNDTNGFSDVFIRDTCLGVPSGCTPSTSLVSVATDGSQANDTGSAAGAVSADGRFVAFQSLASNLVPNDANNTWDIFVRDTCFGAPSGCSPTTTRISVASDGSEGNDGSFVAAISQDGRFASFASLATNLVPTDTNGEYDVFVRDTCFGVTGACIPSTTRVSVASDGGESNDDCLDPSVSANGRFVVFA